MFPNNIARTSLSRIVNFSVSGNKAENTHNCCHCSIRKEVILEPTLCFKLMKILRSSNLNKHILDNKTV